MSSDNYPKESEVVLCTVTKVENGVVFVRIDEYNSEGTIILSEISPGRIRNIREFVSIGKKIVCKVLRMKDSTLELSLRRVSAKERDTILEYYKKERIFASILKSVVGDKTEEIFSKIKQDKDIVEVLDSMKSSPEILKKYLTSQQLDKLKEIISQKKESDKIVQKKISIKSDKEDGVVKIKEILNSREADISYLGSSNFLIRVKEKEYKIANTKLEKIIESIKERAKKSQVIVEVK